MRGSELGVQLESVSVHGGSHVSKSHSRPRSVVSVKEKFDNLDLNDHDDRATHVSSHSRRSGLAPSETGSHRSQSVHRYTVAAPPLVSHATAPVIVVSEDNHPNGDFHAPSIAGSHRSHRSRSQVSESRTVRLHEPDEDIRHAPSDSGRSHRSAHSSHSRAHSYHRSRSPNGGSDSDSGSRLTHENLATHSRSGSPERAHSPAPSRAKSHHSHHSRSGSHASTIRVAEAVVEERDITRDSASHAPSRTSHISAHSRRHSHAGISPLEVVEVEKAPSIAHSKAPSRAASHHSTHRSQVSRAHSAHEDHRSSESESDNDSIYPESSISQRSERSHLSHAPSHHSHHSHHSRHLAPSHAASHHSVHSHHSAHHAPSHAPSHHSSHSHHSVAKALSQAPSHRSAAFAHVVEKEPSVAGSHHSSHSHHSRISGASTLKGSRHDAESPDRESHASSRTLKSSHSHHSHHSHHDKVEAPEPPPAVKLHESAYSHHESHGESSSSDEDILEEHGGSVALLHQRQKYRRAVGRGRAEGLMPLEERPECNGEGFRPHRSRSHKSRSRRSRSHRRSHSHSGHKLDKGVVEVTENRLIRAPTAREVRREREREANSGWLQSNQKVVAVKKEKNGAKLYKII